MKNEETGNVNVWRNLGWGIENRVISMAADRLGDLIWGLYDALIISVMAFRSAAGKIKINKKLVFIGVTAYRICALLYGIVILLVASILLMIVIMLHIERCILIEKRLVKPGQPRE